MKTCIYEIRNLINDKTYIGSTINFVTRKNLHIRNLRNNVHHSNHLQHAWNKYGKENFEFSIIEKVKKIKHIMLEKEQYWLNKFQSYNSKFGYNMSPTAGSNLGCTYSSESKKKMSLSRLCALENGLVIWNKGKKLPKLTKIHKERMSKSLKGRKVSKVTREKIRQKRLGFKHSSSDKLAMSKAHLGQVAWNKGISHTKKSCKRISNSKKLFYNNYVKSCHVRKTISDANKRRIGTHYKKKRIA